MEILVNEKKLDFELDKVLRLSELLENIQEWASRENLFILEYKVNGSYINKDEGIYNSENIEVLEINIGSKQVLIWENINELQNYLIKIASYLIPRLQESENVTQIDNIQLHEGMDWVMKSVDSLNKYFISSGTSFPGMDEKILNSIIINENYVHLLGLINSIQAHVDFCKKQLFYSMLDTMEATELKSLYSFELTSVLSTLEKIASDLTIGKDSNALNSLENIMEWLSMGLLVFERSGSDAAVIEHIKKTLADLEGSLKNSDFVSLADIIDFDLRDSLAALL